MTILQNKMKEFSSAILFFLIIFDLFFDLNFVIDYSKDVPVLYIPSVIFVVIPMAINVLLAMSIITQENSINQKFYQWFARNGLSASIFTVLACADVKILNVLESRIAGLIFFSAPFSDSAISNIFWSSFLNIFIKGIPQVIIQIYYRRNTVTYDIIPLLTLISSVANLLINIIRSIGDIGNELYRVVDLVKNQKVSKYNTPDVNNANFDDDDVNNAKLDPISYISENNLVITIKLNKRLLNKKQMRMFKEFNDADKITLQGSSSETATNPEAIYTSRTMGFTNLSKPINSTEVQIEDPEVPDSQLIELHV